MTLLFSDSTANPDEFIHIFVNQPFWLEKFLEFVTKGVAPSSPNNNNGPSKLVYNTLLELYLKDESESKSEAEKKEKLKKALELLMFSPDVKKKSDKLTFDFFFFGDFVLSCLRAK